MMGQRVEGEELNDKFGYSVSLSKDGNTMTVGAYSGEIGRKGYVKTYTYDEETRVWTPKGKLQGENVDDNFGVSVSLSGDATTLAVGAWRADDRKGYAKTYTYDKANSVWTLKGDKLEGDNEYDWFGTSVSLSDDGTRMTVGAYNAGDGRGYVKVFDY